MARKSFAEQRNALSLDNILGEHHQAFHKIPDPRNRIIHQSMADICQAGFALFHLKFPSLLDFDTMTPFQKANLKTVYGIKQKCSDTQMRRMLDEVDPEVFRQRICEVIRNDFSRVGGISQYQVFDRRLILSLDGVEHFRSSKVHCSSCLIHKVANGDISYRHQMLCGSIVHPNESTVFLAAAEPIVRQDGSQKNDCERNAASRLIDNLSADYKAFKFLVVADSLYGCGPIVEQLLEADHQFVISVKPGDHKTLFQHFRARKAQHKARELVIDEKGKTHRFTWVNNMGLNNTQAHLRVNFLHYQETNDQGKIVTFSWITNRKINRSNVNLLMRIGRSRWKIENETFNTLKNQGYNFEHNYGHGKKHLCTGLAYLMLLAFLTDQLMELCSSTFQEILCKARTRVKVWFSQRALFTTQHHQSYLSIYGKLVELYGVQQV